MKFSIKDFFSECDQIRRKLGICSNLLEKSLIENLIFVQRNFHIINVLNKYVLQEGNYYLCVYAGIQK